jgi:hypothetical protein
LSRLATGGQHVEQQAVGIGQRPLARPHEVLQQQVDGGGNPEHIEREERHHHAVRDVGRARRQRGIERGGEGDLGGER